ncbi:MAG: hypothetical protein KAW56_06060 [Candidatus Marinimicrobia bacterium]|nr:hypothetical protein [Candidatus Neomarinimicrobiota bacterium]
MPITKVTTDSSGDSYRKASLRGKHQEKLLLFTQISPYYASLQGKRCRQGLPARPQAGMKRFLRNVVVCLLVFTYLFNTELVYLRRYIYDWNN